MKDKFTDGVKKSVGNLIQTLKQKHNSTMKT
jgi:hypothetical protein